MKQAGLFKNYDSACVYSSYDEGFNTAAANWFRANPSPIINCIFEVS